MKKYLLLLMIPLIFITACSSSEKQTSEKVLSPSELLTTEDINPFFDYEFSLTEELSRRGSTATYNSNPLGNNPVIIKLYQPNGLLSHEEIKNMFSENKEKRKDSFDIELLDSDAFIAYPNIHYYIGGYYVIITAGSGNGQEQQAVLSSLAKVSYEKLIEKTGVTAEDNIIENDQDNTENNNEEQKEETN